VRDRKDKAMSAQVFAKGTQFGTPESVTFAGQGRLRGAWHRIRQVVAEMNYGSRRIVEVQAPWTVDDQWHRR
jgi:hypothetical protein